MTWPEQDHWKDPRGPLGIDRRSPKLARLTSESPQWLHDLHRNGVSLLIAVGGLDMLIDSLVGDSEAGGA